MKSNRTPRRNAKSNYKAVRKSAAYSRKNISKGSVLAFIASILALAALFLVVNERFLGIEGIPTLKELYESAGFGERSIPVTEGSAEVHFIDVGQGDSELIRTKNKTVLIDCGERKHHDEVINYIERLGIDRLDYVIVSHPHSDHIGGMSYILDKFDVGLLIMPKIKEELTPTSNSYKRLTEAISKNNIAVEFASVGASYSLDEGEMTLLSPLNDYDDLNNYSVTVKFSYGEDSFLFTGDIEKEAEKDILKSGADVSADVLKIAHHGSSTSSTKDFLQAVSPKYAVIEVGNDNDYDHPNEKTIKRLEKADIPVYRTDILGSIVFISNGNGLEIGSEKAA